MIGPVQRSVSEILRPWFRSRVRSAMRGYRVLRQAGRLDVLPNLLRDLTLHPLKRPTGKLSQWVLGAGTSSGELCLRQYLLLRLTGTDFNLSLLASLAKADARVVYPLPSEWQDRLEVHGFKVAKIRCTLLWSGYTVSLMLYGVAECLRILLDARKLTKLEVRRPPYAYFVGLAESNLPRSAGVEIGHWNIINWYVQWSNRPKQIREIWHGVQSAKPMLQGEIPFKFQEKPVPAIERGAILAYLKWLIVSLVICVSDMVRGRWWNLLLLNQAGFAAQARLTSSNRFAKQYLFNNSGWLYRPLWTYELPAKGSECVLYFYSTNCEGFFRNNKPPIPMYGYESMNWPCYLVWDEFQAEFIRRVAQGNYTILVVGEVWFSDAPVSIPPLSGFVLALFDVTPHRVSRYQSLGLGDEFYVPDVMISLVGDVVACSQPLGVTVAWKRKRNIGKTAHPRYRKFADRFAGSEKVVIVDADIAASALIEKSDLVISAPYTSTALLARNAGRPSAYYDPTCMLDQKDPAAHGIPILAGPDELVVWIKDNLPHSVCES